MTKEEFIKRASRVILINHAMVNGAAYLYMTLDKDPSLKEDIDLWRKIYTESGGFPEGNKAANLAIMEKYLFKED